MEWNVKLGALSRVCCPVLAVLLKRVLFRYWTNSGGSVKVTATGSKICTAQMRSASAQINSVVLQAHHQIGFFLC